MKHYTYGFKNIVEKKSDIEYLQDMINDNIIKNNPWLIEPKNHKTTTIHSNDLDELIDNIFTNKITPKPKKKTTTITIELRKKNNDIGILGMLDKIIGNAKFKDTYDYLLTDGTPVKIFSDRIQIGWDTIPLFQTSNYYNCLGATTKKTITDIYINI